MDNSHTPTYLQPPKTNRTGPLLVVGRSNALTQQLCPDIPYDELGEDGFVIRWRDLVDEFVAGYYGPAAPEISDYIRLLHESKHTSGAPIRLKTPGWRDPPFGNHRNIRLNEVADSCYHVFEVPGTYRNDAGLSLWFAPPNSGAIQRLYVDRVIAVRKRDAPDSSD